MWQMMTPTEMSEETFNKHMKYKFFFPTGITKTHQFMKVTITDEQTGRQFSSDYYSIGNKIIDEV